MDRRSDTSARFLRSASLWLAVALMPLAAGCNDSASRPEWAPPIAPSVPAVASVVVESFQMRLSPESPTQTGVYFYEPQVVLREVGGRSAARLELLTFDLPTGRMSFGGDGCLITPEAKAVTAGGTWNSDSVYPYCRDFSSTTSLAGVTLQLSVSFRDENGVFGTAQSSTTVSR